MIDLLRIDDRLIHGQVAIGWTSALQVNTILVVNDEAKNDKVRSMALNMAKPSQVHLYIRNVEESGEIVKKFSQSKKAKVLILVRDTIDARKLIESSDGVIKELNVGGLRHGAGKRKLNDLVMVDDKDIENLKAIQSRGVKVEFRLLPRDKEKTLADYGL